MSAIHKFFSTTVAKTVNYLSLDLGPGPKFIQARYIINAQKGGTLPFILCLMAYYDRWNNSTAWTYAALHGSYGAIWLLKDLSWCPDSKFDVAVPFCSGLIYCTILLGYWAAPFLIVKHDLKVSFFRQFCCSFLYCIGVTMMLAADAYKYAYLHAVRKYAPEKLKNKQVLVSGGIIENNRNPNYLGEMMLYGAFALLVPDFEHAMYPWFVLAFVWIVMFGANMHLKEASLMKKPGYKEYKNGSWLFLPKPAFLVSKMSMESFPTEKMDCGSTIVPMTETTPNLLSCNDVTVEVKKTK